MEDPIYQGLVAPFDVTHTRRGGGGMTLTYVTTEQVVTRLNEELGVFGWSFEIIESGYNDSTTEDWVRGRLTIKAADETAVREQFGCNKRNRDSIETSLKGAASDALKKCAAGVGVALYLSEKEEPARVPERVTESASQQCATCGTFVARGSGGRLIGNKLYCVNHITTDRP